MQNRSNEHQVRVNRALRRAVTAPRLEWEERVLLAAAEAAQACVAPALRPLVACAVADKAADVLRTAESVGSVRIAVAEALASVGLVAQVPEHVAGRLAWRLVFDLWGGPDR